MDNTGWHWLDVYVGPWAVPREWEVEPENMVAMFARAEGWSDIVRAHSIWCKPDGLSSRTRFDDLWPRRRLFLCHWTTCQIKVGNIYFWTSMSGRRLEVSGGFGTYYLPAGDVHASHAALPAWLRGRRGYGVHPTQAGQRNVVQSEQCSKGPAPHHLDVVANREKSCVSEATLMTCAEKGAANCDRIPYMEYLS